MRSRLRHPNPKIRKPKYQGYEESDYDFLADSDDTASDYSMESLVGENIESQSSGDDDGEGTTASLDRDDDSEGVAVPLDVDLDAESRNVDLGGGEAAESHDPQSLNAQPVM